MLTSDQEYMNLALELGLQAAREGDIPVGALVVDPCGEIIGRGRNRRRIEHDPTAHAEVVALREAARNLGVWNLNGCSLYVTLEPCPMCAGAIISATAAGSHLCFFGSEATLACSASQIDNVRYAQCATPLILLPVLLALIVYLAAGFLVG